MGSVGAPVTVAALDAAGCGRDSRATVGPLFEDAPGYLALLAAARPFGTWDDALRPGGGDRAGGARGRSRSSCSARTRGSARHPARCRRCRFASRATTGSSRRPIAALGPLNDAYEARFGFRYVIFVAGRPRSAIVPLLEQALDETGDAERDRGLRDVVAIARARAAAMGMLQEEGTR